MSQDYGPAIWLGDPNVKYGGWGKFTRKWIIIHATAGDITIEDIQRTFIANARAGNPSSTHYGIGRDGRSGQYVPESENAYGNGPITGPAGHAIAGTGNAHDPWWDDTPFHNANPVTFSIEHCKARSDNGDELTPEQKAASFALVKHLCDTWGIPKKVYGTATPDDADGGISGHFAMDPIERARCPGPYPWQELQDYLDGHPSGGTGGDGGQKTVGIPAGWKDDGTTLTATNGKTVVLGFRDHILGNPWYAGDVPLDQEHGDADGDEQHFRYTILRYHKATNAITESDRVDEIQAQANAAQSALTAELTQAQHDRDAAQQQASQAEADYQREQGLYATIAADDNTLHTKLAEAQTQIDSLKRQLAAAQQTSGGSGAPKSVAEAVADLVVEIARELGVAAPTPAQPAGTTAGK